MIVLRLRALLATMALAAAPVIAQAQDDPRLSRSVLAPAMDAIVRTGEFVASDGATLAYDLYSARGQQGPRPALVLVSGTEDARDWGFYRDFARLAVERGFVAVIPVKRFQRGGEGIAQGRADTLALLNQIGDLEATLLDRSRLCLWTFSGGGTTLSIAYGPEKTRLACALGHYPVGALAQADPAGEWAKTYMPASVAAQHAGPDSPPTLIVRAGLDQAELNKGLMSLVQALADRNAPVTLVNLPEARHGFDLIDDTDWSRAAIEASFAFARDHTK